MHPLIYTIIATAFKRTTWLANRSLLSVYRQKGLDPVRVKIIIVDDNADESEYENIREAVHSLRTLLNLKDGDFPTRVVRNSRTRFMSGTGAWNTGIHLAFAEDPESYLAILDDDDEYFPEHLKNCIQRLNTNKFAEAVFQELIWIRPDGDKWEFPLSPHKITPEDFYIGNPGIQGSNMFFKTQTLVACGAFDESFESSTDRDLIIRLLWYLNDKPSKIRNHYVEIVNNAGVIHYAHDKASVTADPERKHKGLNRFYEKFKLYFTERDYQLSLKRAALLFQYKGYNPLKECIVILMAMRNNAGTVEKAIDSILSQKATKRPVYIFISDDGSIDESRQIVNQLVKSFPNLFLFSNQFGSIAKNRNWLQNQAKEFPECMLIGRLDADDTMEGDDILQRIEKLWDDHRFDVLLMSNNQVLNSQFTGFINRPDEGLKNDSVLLHRTRQMSEGMWEAELPSCNVFVNPAVAIPYSEVKSAEDHRNLIDYLLQFPQLNIQIKPDWVYCNYCIDKHILSSEREKVQRQKARRELYKYTLMQTSDKFRKQKAEAILQKWFPGKYRYLGEGFSGVVFHDGEWVYKVHLPKATNNFNEIDNILYLKVKLALFHGRKHFYQLREITEVENTFILVYPYEKSEPVKSLSREDMIGFLAEMWQMKVICRSITKENNFVRVNGTVKLIDYEIESYSDNLFLNTAARAFIQLDDFNSENVSYQKLKRSTINHFGLPELSGFFNFVKEVFQRCVENNNGEFKPLRVQGKMETDSTGDGLAIYDGRDLPAVTLLIKACVQDSATLYHDVRQLVIHLTKGVQFSRRALLLDLYKEQDFLRQYTLFGNQIELMESAFRLKSEGVIDEVIIAPEDNGQIEAIHRRWFGIGSQQTHTDKGVPVTSQLYAFEQAKGDFILQMDVDVIIGSKNSSFDYLHHMIAALDENPNAVSIGFQIYQPGEVIFQPIIGGDGSIAPDVRCSLLHVQRMLASRPLPNQCSDKGWKLPWYRSLEKKQKDGGLVSLRGGAADAFYLHIQNYRKTNRWVWHTVQQRVKQGLIPPCQQSQSEVAGDIFDWCVPKRAEEFVVVLYIDEANTKSLEQTLQTIFAQDASEAGLVLVNNTGLEDFIEPYRDKSHSWFERTTFINFEHKSPCNEVTFRAIRYYLNNPESFVCLIRQGDLLIYPSVFSECMNRLQTYGADVLIGKEISERTITHTGMSRSNFLHPRQEPEHLANGLAIFRKYLFDSLSQLDLKEKMSEAKRHIAGYNKITQSYLWLDDVSFISILTPIVELSSNPIRFDHFNVLRSRAINEEQIAEAITFVQEGSPRKEGAWEKGRKTFLPNTNKIELDITYDCNLKCFHCNRSCTQAPTGAHMTLDQIQQFVQESVALGKQWELINVLGGEPTLHPQFAEIVHCLLHEYVIPYSPETTLQVTSNGYGEQVQQKLEALPRHSNLVVNTNSFKEDRAVPYFTPFNLAPADEPDSQQHEYHKGCWVTSYCGIGLNHLGYFACGVAGGIERILKAGEGIQHLAELGERLHQQLNTYCRLCGNFTAYAENRGDFMERAEKASAPKTAMSETWKQLYKEHNHDRAASDTPA